MHENVVRAVHILHAGQKYLLFILMDVAERRPHRPGRAAAPVHPPCASRHSSV
jgi:hypothetical protein